LALSGESIDWDNSIAVPRIPPLYDVLAHKKRESGRAVTNGQLSCAILNLSRGE